MDVLGGSQIYVYVCNFHGHWSVTELYNCVWMVLAGSSSTRVYIVHFTVKGAAIDTVACLMWPSAEVARRRSKVNDRVRLSADRYGHLKMGDEQMSQKSRDFVYVLA